PIDGVEEANQHPLFATHATSPQPLSKSCYPVGKSLVAPGAARIDIGGLGEPAAVTCALEDVVRKIVVAWNRVERPRWREPSPIKRHRDFSPTKHTHYEGSDMAPQSRPSEAPPFRGIQTSIIAAASMPSRAHATLGDHHGPSRSSDPRRRHQPALQLGACAA